MDASFLLIQPAAPEPIYRQIVGQVQRMIASGQLKPGDVLPSVRDVAGFHAINPMTVSRAYSLLESEGALERLRGRGMAVAAAHRRAQSEDKRMTLIDSHLREVARRARELELPREPVLRRLSELLEKDE
jgi:GntR family transcriptional regulator